MANNISVADGDRLTMAFGASAGKVLATALVAGALVEGAVVTGDVVEVVVLEPHPATAASAVATANERKSFKGVLRWREDKLGTWHRVPRTALASRVWFRTQIQATGLATRPDRSEQMDHRCGTVPESHRTSLVSTYRVFSPDGQEP